MGFGVRGNDLSVDTPSAQASRTLCRHLLTSYPKCRGPSAFLWFPGEPVTINTKPIYVLARRKRYYWNLMPMVFRYRLCCSPHYFIVYVRAVIVSEISTPVMASGRHTLLYSGPLIIVCANPCPNTMPSSVTVFSPPKPLLKRGLASKCSAGIFLFSASTNDVVRFAGKCNSPCVFSPVGKKIRHLLLSARVCAPKE